MWAHDADSVLLHRWSGRKSVSVGVWSTHGAAHDPDQWAGLTHLVEHLTLRRCGGRDRRDLARLIDQLGGEVDAWTSSEAMGLSVQTTLDALPDALSVIRDAVLEPTFAVEDFELERQVALAELELLNDDPGEQVSEAILEAAWGVHPLARSIIGTPESLARLNPEILRRHHADNLLRPGGMVLAFVGDVARSDLERSLAELPVGGKVQRPALAIPRWVGGRVVLDKPATDQVHVRLAFPACRSGSSMAAAFSTLARVLGGGNSSRLFQRLREEEGLTYDIWSDLTVRSVCGLLEVGWTCSPDRSQYVWNTVMEELRRLPLDLEDDEVEVAVQGMARALQMEAESAGGRASLDVAEVLERDRRFDLDMVLAELTAIRPARVRELAGKVLRLESMASAVCGPESVVDRLGGCRALMGDGFRRVV